jgi:hypothetical protein
MVVLVVVVFIVEMTQTTDQQVDGLHSVVVELDTVDLVEVAPALVGVRCRVALT